MLEWMPSDSGKKNRQLLWKKFTSGDPNQWFGPIGLHPSGPTSWSSEELSDFKRGMAAGWQWGEDTLDYVIQEHPLYKAEQKGEEIAFDAIMYVTPKQYEDDVAAMIFYGSFGLLDPTNIADVPVWRARGFSLRASVGFMLARAFIPAAIIGWWIDPADKREGGLAEEEWYQELMDKITDPSWWWGRVPIIR